MAPTRLSAQARDLQNPIPRKHKKNLGHHSQPPQSLTRQNKCLPSDLAYFWARPFYSHNPTLSFYPREIDPDSQKAANLNKCDFHPCISCHSKISYCTIFYSLLHKPWIIHIFLNQPIFKKLSFVFLRKRSVQDLSWQQKQSHFQKVTQTFMAIKKISNL